MKPAAILAGFGLPGALSDRGFATLHAVARERLPDAAVLHANTLAAVMDGLAAAPDAPLVLTSSCPEPALADWVLTSGARPLLFWEGATAAAAGLLRAGLAQDGFGAATPPEIGPIRSISASAACLGPLARHTAVQLIDRRDAGDAGIDALAAEICRHAGLDPPEAGLAGRQPHLGALPGAGENTVVDVAIQAGEALLARPGDAMVRLADDILAPFDRLVRDGTLSQITWPRPVFLLGDRPGEALPETVDLTGGARCLVYGPYLHLPAGRWTARLELGFGGHLGRQSFAVELLGPDLLARIRLQSPASGRYAARFGFASTAPQTPIELRLIMERGAIEGSVSLLKLSLSREGA